MDTQSGEVTRLLGDLRSGKKEVEAPLFSLVYDELRRIAGGYMREERRDHTLQPTALVHEAYLRLVDQSEHNFQNRAHFIGIGAHLMRQILVDHARRYIAEKRGGGVHPTELTDVAGSPGQLMEDLLTVNELLLRLDRRDERQSLIVELRFFGGLTEEEIAEYLGITSRTVKRDWSVARAWLFAEITK